MASTLADQQKNHGLDQHGTTRIRHGFMIYQHSRWGVHFRTRLNISPKLELLPWAKWCVPFCLPCINVSNWCFFQVLLNGESTGCTWIQGRQLGETTTHFAIWKAIPQQGMNFTPRRFVGHGFFPFLFFHSFRLLLVLMILQASWPSMTWTCQMVRPLNVGLVRTRMQSSWSCTRQKVRTTWLACLHELWVLSKFKDSICDWLEDLLGSRVPGLCETPNGSFRVLQDSGRGWLQGKGLKRQRVPISAMPRIELRILPPQTCLQTASNPRGSRDFSSLAVNQNQWFAHVCTIWGQGDVILWDSRLVHQGGAPASARASRAVAPCGQRHRGCYGRMVSYMCCLTGSHPPRSMSSYEEQLSIAIAFFCVPLSELDMATQETCKQLVHTPSCTKF